MSNLDTIHDFLKDIQLMQLATSSQGKPWLCSVWYVIDEKNNVYWTSRKTRRHSQEIGDNPNIACTFHGDFHEGLGQKGQAVIMAGTASLVTESEEIEYAFNLYEVRYPKLSGMQTKQVFLSGSGDHFFYKLTPTEIVLWDEVNHSDNPRVQIV